MLISETLSAGIPCRANHACGHHGTPYSYCYTDARRNWDYCSVKECGTERTCYVDNAGNVRLPEWAVRLYIPCDTSRRTKRRISFKFRSRHIIEDDNEWNEIDRARLSDEIRNVLRDRFITVQDNRKREPERLTLPFNTFINLVRQQDRNQFRQASDNAPQSTPQMNEAGTNMGNYYVVTFRSQNEGRDRYSYSRDPQRSGRKAVYVHACNEAGTVNHYHGVLEPLPEGDG